MNLKEWNELGATVMKTNSVGGSSLLYCQLGLTFDDPKLAPGDQAGMKFDIVKGLQRFVSKFEPELAKQKNYKPTRRKRSSDLNAEELKEGRNAQCLGLIEEK
jgi:hypothetical protein